MVNELENVEIVDTDVDNIGDFSICGYKNKKQPGYLRKIQWTKQRYAEGLKSKMLVSGKDGAVGGIEYIPGENAWRPVEAAGYLFIHCIFIVSKKYKERGFGGLLLEACIADAQKQKKLGVAVVTRKGSWMAGKELFLKYGFEVVDKAPKDFELLVKKFDRNAPNPKFKGNWEEKLNNYSSGLYIFKADQCPYLIKSVNEIVETAQQEYGMTPTIIEFKNSTEAQNSPCPFGTFCIVYNGKVVAENPVSKRRFMNIINKLNKLK
jgi:L-amino acid N-acyltransferase YncA